MGKLSCLFSFSRKSKTSMSKDMGESMPISTIKVPGLDVLEKSTVILQQNIGMKYSDLYGYGNETEELVSGSGSENEGLSAKQSGNLLIDMPGELADDENEKEFDVCDLERCRPFTEDNIRPPTKEVAPDRVGTREFEDALHFEMPADHDISSISQATRAVADYECPRDCYSAQFSECAAVFPANKGSERALSDDEMLTGHTSDPGVYQTDVLSVCNSPLSHGKFSPEMAINFASPEGFTVDEEGCKFEFHSRIPEQPPNVSKLAFNQCARVIPQVSHSSPQSEFTFHSADKVILKAEASSKVLPFSKRKSWWRIFMVSHRNIHKEGPSSATLPDGEMNETLANPIMGYTSDICDASGVHNSDSANLALDIRQVSALREQAKAPSAGERSDGFEGLEYGSNECLVDLSGQATSSGPTIFWPSKEWIAFSSETADLRRVEDWVSNIEPAILLPEAESSNLDPNNILEIESQRDQVGAGSPDLISKDGALTADAEIANAVVKSLNPFSTVAHISGIGLRVVPSLGMFSSLKTLNMSANCIVRIVPGSLPRSLHSLDLSRNRIAVVEGLRDLTRLRVLNLSYNRISRVGHGLANCTLIKELYLAGNKISDVEGLHRLLKLSVLDLSFNKLTTSKSLGQLAANYSSLLALNILANPVHANLGEEQLRKLVISLAPHLTYLNRQPIKAVSAREVVVDSVARAALGSSQRANKSNGSRGLRRAGGAQSTLVQKNRLPSYHTKKVDKRHGQSKTLGVSEFDKSKNRHTSSQWLEKGMDKEQRHLSRISPVSTHHEQQLRSQFMGLSEEGMSRSRSEGTLWDQS